VGAARARGVSDRRPDGGGRAADGIRPAEGVERIPVLPDVQAELVHHLRLDHAGSAGQGRPSLGSSWTCAESVVDDVRDAAEDVLHHAPDLSLRRSFGNHADDELGRLRS